MHTTYVIKFEYFCTKNKPRFKVHDAKHIRIANKKTFKDFLLTLSHIENAWMSLRPSNCKIKFSARWIQTAGQQKTNKNIIRLATAKCKKNKRPDLFYCPILHIQKLPNSILTQDRKYALFHSSRSVARVSSIVTL